MDSVIQSLTQSPLVKHLSDVPNNVKRFTNDIPDNAPYRSLSKEVLNPVTGNNSSTEGVVRFKINRSGILNRLFLRAQLYRSTVQAFSRIRIQDDVEDSRPTGPEFFANWFVKATLFIGGKEVETLYPESILFRSSQNTSCTLDSRLQGLTGFPSEEEFGEDQFDLLHRKLGANMSNYINFLVPLEFSFFQFFKDSLDTNFFPLIEVEVEKKAISVQQTETPGSTTKLGLVCKYHNLHGHFKTQLRNLKHPQETRSLLITDNYRLNTTPVKSEFINPSGDWKGEDGHSYGKHVFKFDHINLFVTDMLITFIRVPDFNDAVQTARFSSDVVSVPSNRHYVRFTLKANDRVLFDKYHYEMFDHQQNTSNLDIQDRVDDMCLSKVYDDLYEYGLEGSTELTFWDRQLAFYRQLPMYRIPLSLFSSDEFLSGGLQLDNLTNVELTIQGEPFLPHVNNTYDKRGCEARIILRHKKLVRVDGKNGTIS